VLAYLTVGVPTFFCKTSSSCLAFRDVIDTVVGGMREGRGTAFGLGLVTVSFAAELKLIDLVLNRVSFLVLSKAVLC
jgi:hypothetical protein